MRITQFSAHRSKAGRKHGASSHLFAEWGDPSLPDRRPEKDFNCRECIGSPRGRQLDIKARQRAGFRIFIALAGGMNLRRYIRVLHKL